jgi:hypothetical protein
MQIPSDQEGATVFLSQTKVLVALRWQKRKEVQTPKAYFSFLRMTSWTVPSEWTRGLRNYKLDKEPYQEVQCYKPNLIDITNFCFWFREFYA